MKPEYESIGSNGVRELSGSLLIVSSVVLPISPDISQDSKVKSHCFQICLIIMYYLQSLFSTELEKEG
jgi:hypothetical protein